MFVQNFLETQRIKVKIKQATKLGTYLISALSIVIFVVSLDGIL